MVPRGSSGSLRRRRPRAGGARTRWPASGSARSYSGPADRPAPRRHRPGPRGRAGRRRRAPPRRPRRRSSAPAPIASVAPPSPRRGPHRRRSARGTGAGEETAVALDRAEPALHVRPLRDRRLEPLRPRRRALGRREPGPVVQPALHLRARGAGQDPPPARDRQLRPRRPPAHPGPVRLHRDADERVRRRDPQQRGQRVPAPLPRGRRPPRRRHPVPRAQPAAPGGVLPHLQLAARRRQPDRPVLGPAAQADPAPRGPAPDPPRVGPDHRRPAARSSRPAWPSCG